MRSTALALTLVVAGCSDPNAFDPRLVEHARANVAECHDNQRLIRTLNDQGTKQGRSNLKGVEQLCGEQEAMLQKLQQIAREKAGK